MATDRCNILCILKILEEYSDADHIMSVADIRGKMQSIYDLDPDRRTIYSAIEALNSMGYEISTFADNGKGYFLQERQFEPGEIRLLVDAVNSFDYISTAQTNELIDKLKKLVNVHARKKVSFSSVVHADKKSPNPQVLLNIELLDEAINSARKVSFIYTDYDYDKKLKPRRDRRYSVSPYALLCENDKYYLVCLTDGHDEPNLYRIDFIKEIKISDEPLAKSRRAANLNSTKKMVFAHSGEPVSIRLRCDKQALRYVIEDFGKDTVIIPQPDGGFEAVVSAAEKGMVYWALQYIQNVEVLHPASLRQKVAEAAREGVKKYE